MKLLPGLNIYFWSRNSITPQFMIPQALTHFRLSTRGEPPSIPAYILSLTNIEAVNTLLATIEEIFQLLRTNCSKLKNIWKARLISIRLVVDSLKVTGILNSTDTQKLSKCYFGPFKILQKIGPVAYKLDLSSHLKIHPVFHVSILRQYIGDLPSCPLPLPPISNKHHPILTPLAILDWRTVNTGSNQIEQVLVQWEGTQPNEATSKNTSDLGDKVVFKGEEMIQKQLPTLQKMHNHSVRRMMSYKPQRN